MRRQSQLALGMILVAGASFAVVTALRKRRAYIQEETSQWQVITVQKPFMEIAEAPLPEPLENISDIAAVDMRPTDDTRGTEIGVRLNDKEKHSASALHRIKDALEATLTLLEPDELTRNKTKQPSQHSMRSSWTRIFSKHRYSVG